MRTVNYEKKEMIRRTGEKNKSYEKQNNSYICKKEFNPNLGGSFLGVRFEMGGE